MKKAVIQARQKIFALSCIWPCKTSKHKEVRIFAVAAISLYEDETEHTWYLFFKRNTLNRLLKNLFLKTTYVKMTWMTF